MYFEKKPSDSKITKERLFKVFTKKMRYRGAHVFN